jgi:hypothetical protein
MSELLSRAFLKADVWKNIVQTIPARTALIVGDAVRVPTVIEILDYSKIQDFLLASSSKRRQTAGEILTVAKNAEEIVRPIK